MILKIQNSRTIKGVSVTLALSIFFQLVAPTQALALTGGPAQPEFSSFTPIGVSDMVDLSSGDMSYNIPLMDVGGYPLNIAYSAGVGMDEEASWVGLGWNLSVGQINRNVRGLPDDFDGSRTKINENDIDEEEDEANGDWLTYENYLKPNITAGASFQFTPNAFGAELTSSTSDDASGLTIGLSAVYNNYNGFTLKPSVGVQVDVANNVTVGFNAESSPEGLSISPNVSFHKDSKDKKERANNRSASFGVAMNSRQGLSAMTISANVLKNKDEIKKNTSVRNLGSLGSTISFTDDLYTPTTRTAMLSNMFTFNASFGLEFLGVEGNGQVTGYGTIIEVKDKEDRRPAFGYTNTEKSGAEGVQDFNREKDGAVGVNTANLALTNYTYDIYSVQGQGVSGMYRPFRNQVGYVHDPLVKDGSLSGTGGIEIGSGNNFHMGISSEATFVNSHSGNWENQNNILSNLQESQPSNQAYEKVHYKNVGDLSADVDFEDMSTRSGDYAAARVPFGGYVFNRSTNSKYTVKNDLNGEESNLSTSSQILRTQRQLRNQAIINVTKEQLDRGVGYGPSVRNDQNQYVWGTDGVAISSEAKPHHTAEVQITRNDGARYIYGLPAYNTKKVEATFAVNAIGDCSTGLVQYSPNQLDNPKNLPNDKFLERITTPGFVHTHMLTSVLSTDYVDRELNGPTPDDFGSYTKFSYKNMNDNYKWRVPYTDASYNEGLKTDSKDDRGNYIYGEKQIYLIDKIETKTHIAIFHYSERADAHGVKGEKGGLDSSQDSYKLDKISLYSIEEYDENNTAPNDVTVNLSTPIKEVHFVYSYDLCQGVPNNDGSVTDDIIGQSGTLEEKQPGINNGGKLTLEKIYFTYRNSNMGKYTDYEFKYNDVNPDYDLKGYDTWGNYMPNPVVPGCSNLDSITAAEFPYTMQDGDQNLRAQAWTLEKIELPSGGEITVDLESDDYGFVQDRETMRMFKVVGAGSDRDGTASINSNETDEFFGNQISNSPKTYIYVRVDEDDPDILNSIEIDKYLKGLKNNPIYFRFLMNMTQQGGTAGNELESKFDYVTGYFEYEEINSNSPYNGDSKLFDVGGTTYLSIPVKVVNKEGGLFNNPQKVNPFSKAAWHFGRKYLSQHVYSNQPNGDTEDIEAMITEILSPNAFNGLVEIFTGPNATLENKDVGRRFIKEKSWVRLANPRSYKLGGGCRVKEVRMSDKWEEMVDNPGYQTMKYGQKYDYKTVKGTTSGVATYEPIGNKENPFVKPVFSTTKHLLAPNEDNFVEEPFGESFFPSPQVTYSRVSVENIEGGINSDNSLQVKRLHKTGKVVTEFYTSKDYPTIVDQTKIQHKEDKTGVLGDLLSLYTEKSYTASQGYVIHLNDMNGKQKAQWVYAEGQEAAISGVEYIYDNHSSPDEYSSVSVESRNKGRLNNEVVVITEDGEVERRTIGVEVDMINDFREKKTVTRVTGININIMAGTAGTVPVSVPMPIPDFSHAESQVRTVSTTKVINTFGILKETIAYDAGASVSTRNLAWDANTGEVLLTETVDEYSDKYYTLNYPAHWVYDGMAQASKNVGFEGVLNASQQMANASLYLTPGDEIEFPNTTVGISNITKKGWVSSLLGNSVQLIDEYGGTISTFGKFRIIRSGHRNLQSAGIMNVTLMKNPLLDASQNLISEIDVNFLKASAGDWVDWKIINAGAVDYSDEWFVGCECGLPDNGSASNPYLINEKGVWRTKSSRTYLTGRNTQGELTPRQQGFFTSFAPMYQRVFNTSTGESEWDKNLNDWTYVAEVTEYSPYGFELENKDALDRYSAAQYGYNNTFPVAVGANTKYKEIGFDGFEDHFFEGCPYSPHFQFEDHKSVTPNESHTGRYSIQVNPGQKVTMDKKLDCETTPEN